MRLIHSLSFSKVIIATLPLLLWFGMVKATLVSHRAIDIEEAPADIALDSYTIDENRDPGNGGGIGVGVFENNPDNDILYELVPGEGSRDNGAFRISIKTDETQLQATQMFDFETKNTYSIRVRATQDGSIEKILTIQIVNLPEPPTDITLSSNTVDQEAAPGTIVDTLSARGGPSVDITYSLVSGAGSDDNAAFTIDGNTLKTSAAFGTEGKTTYAIRVQASGDGTFAKTFTINANPPPNQPPVANAGPDQTVVDENGDGVEEVMLDGSASSDTDGPITYSWLENSSEIATIVQPTINLAVGSHTITLIVTDDDGETASDQVVITVNAPANQPPVANAGPDQTVEDQNGDGTQAVTLDGSASSDADGTITYSWQENNAEIATGVQPTVNLSVGSHTITLTVTDDDGETASDQVLITVNEPANQAPIANAGPDQTITDEDRNGEAIVTLDGSASSDADGNISAYSWQEDGSEIASGVQPQVALTVGAHTITLTVTDDDGETASDQITVTVNEATNQPPVANAGPNQTVVDQNGDGTQAVTLDGSASSDADGTITYSWLEDGSEIATGVQPTVNLAVGPHTITLVVTDDDEETDSDQVTITVNAAPNQSPIANAGPDQTVEDQNGDGTQAVTLDGSASSDADGTITYSWLEDGSEIATGVQPTVNLTVGSHTIALIVTDDDGETDSDQVTITVNAAPNQPPVANAGPNQTITDEDRNGEAMVNLDGSASSDPDGTIAAYSWQENNLEIATGVQPMISLSVGSHTITLVVTDNDGETDSDQIIVTVNEATNQPPVANAGPNQTIIDADRDGVETVILNGLASSDPDGSIVRYQWRENDSQGKILVEGGTASASVPLGDNLMALVVEDNDGATASDAIMIYVDAPPLAEAGSPQTVTDEDGDGVEEVTLDGSASSDTDGTVTAYEWTWDDGSITGVKPVVAMPTGTTTAVTLTVTDNEGLSHSDDTSVTVNAPAAPDGISISNSSVLENQPKGTKVGDLDVDDALAVTYFLPEDEADNKFFALRNRNELVTDEVFDHEARDAYNVFVRATYFIGAVEQDFTISVENIEEAPADIALNSYTIDENRDPGNGGGIGVGVFENNPDNDILYELVPGEGSQDNGAFRISIKTNETQLQATQAFDFETKNTYSIRVRATQDGSIEKILTIQVVNLPEPPTDITLSANTVDQEASTGTTVGTFSASGGAPVSTYSLVSGAGSDDNTAFTIDGNTLKTSAAFGTEDKTTYAIRVQASGDGTFTKTFTINANPPPNQPPVANAGPDQTVMDQNGDGTQTVMLDGSASSDEDGTITFSWQENNAEIATGVQPTVNLTVGSHTITLVVTDNDGETDSDQVAITVNEPANQPPVANAGPDQTVVDQNGDGTQAVTLDGSASSDADGTITYSWKENNAEIATGVQPTVNLAVGSHTITLTVTDDDGETASDQVAITVNALPNQLPVANAGPDQTITDENGDNSVSATLNGSASSDADGTITYSWLEDGSEIATGVQPTVNLTVGTHTITLTVTDDDGGTASDQVIITVNGPEEPTISLSKAEVQENREAGTTVGNFSTTSAITLAYSLPNDQADNQFFRIVNGNELVTDAVFDRETKASYTIRVTATYAVGSVQQDFTITILNVDETPTNITLDKTTIAENLANATVGTFQTEGGQGPFTYTLTGNNNDNSLFSIDGSQLKTNSGLNFEADPSLEIEVTSTNDGSITRRFTITVTNVEEPPTDILLSSNTVNENEPRNTQVGTFSVTGGAQVPVSYQFFGGGTNDNNSFQLDENRLLTNAVFDREVKATYTIRIRAIGDGSFTKNFTITITNVNDAPVISITEDRILFEEGNAPVKILPDIMVADIDNAVLSSATLTFVNNYVNGEDELVGGTWNAETGALTISGPIAVADLQSALRNVTYKNNKTVDPTSSAREIRVIVNDGALDSNTERVFVLVDNPNVPPSVADFEVETPEDQPLTLTADNFEANYEDTDNEFPNQIYIVSAPTSGILTVDGQVITNATIVANRPRGFLVDFGAIENFVYTPEDNVNGTDNFRWNLYDNLNASNEAQVNIVIIPVNDAPTISAPTQLTAQEATPLALNGISYQDIDNDNLSLTLSVTNGFLAVDSSVSESVSILDEDEGGAKRLQIVSSATDLTAIMAGISYISGEILEEDRDQLQIVLTDSPSNPSGAFTDEATVSIVITPQNDAPVLANLEESPLMYTENSEPMPITETLEISDQENNTILAATITIVDGEEGDELIFNSTQTIQSTFNNNTLLLQGEASLEDYQAALRSVLFVSANNNPGDTPRQVQIQVNDENNGMSNIVTRTIIFTPVDDPTVIEGIDNEIFYIIGDSLTNLFTNGMITDPDNDTLTSLTVQFENGSFVPETDNLGLIETSDLSVTLNEETGTLTITGEADLATYQSILQTIFYQYTGSDEAVKTLSVTTTTPDEISSSATQQIRIVFNQPPQLADIDINVNSGQVYAFTSADFLNGYSDPDNFPTADGFEAIRITSLPEAGQLLLSQEVITASQLGVNGLLIARDDIPRLSYVTLTNDVTSDAFMWNATDGAEFAEQDATVTFAINLLSVTIGSDPEEICNGESTTLTATVQGGAAPFTYEWTCDLADCAISGTEEVVSVSPEENSNYQVTITDANGVQTSSIISIKVAICNLTIPSGFTPNGDNINDTWQLQNISTFETKVVEVYDRFGHQVFYSDNYTTPWNGEHNNKKLPTGTYYYRIELDGGAQSYQGKVTILQ